MYEPLFECIEQYIQLTKESKDLIISSSHLRELKPKDIFLDKGIIVDKLGFILSGVVRFFYEDESGEDRTALFHKEHEFIASLTSYFQMVPSSGVVQAETNCKILVFERNDWVVLCEKIPKWLFAFNSITTNYLLDQTKFQRILINKDTKTSYLTFLEKYPTIVNQVPLGHIASYLGMTQSNLSRVRNEVLRK